MWWYGNVIWYSCCCVVVVVVSLSCTAWCHAHFFTLLTEWSKRTGTNAYHNLSLWLTGDINRWSENSSIMFYFSPINLQEPWNFAPSLTEYKAQNNNTCDSSFLDSIIIIFERLLKVKVWDTDFDFLAVHNLERLFHVSCNE